MEEAIRRTRLYAEAGADLLFVESLESAEEMREVNRRLPLPTVANMVEGGRSPALTAEELQKLGYAAALFPVASVYAAAWAVRGLADTLRRTGTTAGWSGQMMDFADFNRLVGLEEIRRLERGDLSGL